MVIIVVVVAGTPVIYIKLYCVKVYYILLCYILLQYSIVHPYPYQHQQSSRAGPGRLVGHHALPPLHDDLGARPPTATSPPSASLHGHVPRAFSIARVPRNTSPPRTSCMSPPARPRRVRTPPRTSPPHTSPPRTSPPRTSPPRTSPPRTSPAAFACDKFDAFSLQFDGSFISE